MNGSIPPPLPPAAKPQTAGLSIASLVLGILSVPCFAIFTGIPAIICGHLALSKIEGSGGTLTGRGMAIAGLVTGYLGSTICMIGLLAAIAIPNFVKARDTAMHNACLNNLRLIDAAKNEWALQNHKSAEDTPTENDLLPYLPNHQFPHCPAGGVYTINQDAIFPSCSVTNHVLVQ